VQPPCEIQGGGQEMAVMVGILITTIQVNLVPSFLFADLHCKLSAPLKQLFCR